MFDEVLRQAATDMFAPANEWCITVFDYRGWPTHWQRAKALNEASFALKGNTHTVADFDVAREAGPIEGVLQGLWVPGISGGPIDGEVAVIRDGTGWMQVFLPFAATDLGQGHNGGCEVDVVAVPQGETGFEPVRRILSTVLRDAIHPDASGRPHGGTTSSRLCENWMHRSS